MKAIASEGRQIIPLSFFYSENRLIADEQLSYCTPLSLESIETGVPYSVTFSLLRKNVFIAPPIVAFNYNSKRKLITIPKN
jgi:hypothetical protein